jgi:hypothetical protein
VQDVRQRGGWNNLLCGRLPLQNASAEGTVHSVDYNQFILYRPVNGNTLLLCQSQTTCLAISRIQTNANGFRDESIPNLRRRRSRTL